MVEFTISSYSAKDQDALWDLLAPEFQAGETYAIDPYISKKDAVEYWTGGDSKALVVRLKGQVVGTYYLRPNLDGGGAHVCNCGFIVDKEARGMGVGRFMFEHALELAVEQGYLAMQFNFVIATNDRAIKLWQSEGFEIVGRLPKAYQHPKAGYVDAFVMFRELV